MPELEAGHFATVRGTIRPGTVRLCIPKTRKSTMQAMLDSEDGRSCSLVFGTQSEAYITTALEGAEVIAHGCLEAVKMTSGPKQVGLYVSVIAVR